MIAPSHRGTQDLLAKLGETHLNYTEAKKLVPAASAPRNRAMYGEARYNSDTYKLTLVSRDERVPDASFKFRPMSAFGSSKETRQWTNVVRTTFSAAVTSGLTMKAGALPTDLVKFAQKAGAGRHDVLVKITKGALSMAQGKDAAAVKFDSTGERSASATISQADLARAMEYIGQLAPVAVRLIVDPAGLVAIQAETAVATVSVFIPTLLEGGARSPALLEPVMRPGAQPATEQAPVAEPADDQPAVAAIEEQPTA